MVSWWVHGRGGVFLVGDFGLLLELGLGLESGVEAGTNSRLGLTSGEGGFEVVGERSSGWGGGFGAGKSRGEEGEEEDGLLSIIIKSVVC